MEITFFRTSKEHWQNWKMKNGVITSQQKQVIQKNAHLTSAKLDGSLVSVVKQLCFKICFPVDNFKCTDNIKIL